MGYVATGEKYNEAGDTAISDLNDVHKIVDDMLCETETFEQHAEQVEKVLQRCRKYQITLNPDKFEFAKPEVKFAGFIIGRNGIKADPAKVKAIAEFKAPSNITELRGFIGLVNQLAQFVPNLAARIAPLRPLLSPKNAFVCTHEMDMAFKCAKDLLLSPGVLSQFDPKLPMRLETDASKIFGFGYVLLQQHADGEWLCLFVCLLRFYNHNLVLKIHKISKEIVKMGKLIIMLP